VVHFAPLLSAAQPTVQLNAAQPGPSVSAAQPTLLQPGPQLRAEGIPALVARPGAAANDDPASLRLVAWHPVQPSMLVLARSGGRAQLHLLLRPQADRSERARLKRLTDGRDPVEGARWEPEAGEYLVFRRDQGGNEAWRLFMLRVPQDFSGIGGSSADSTSSAPSPVPGPAPVPSPGPDPGPHPGTEVALSSAQTRVSEYQFLPQGQGLVYLAESLDRQAEGDARQAHSRLLWVDPLAPQQTRQTRLLAEVKGGRFTNLQVASDGTLLFSRTVGRDTERLQLRAPGGEVRVLRPAAGAHPADDEAWLWSAQALRGEHRHLVVTGARSGARLNLLTDLRADLELLAPPRGAPAAAAETAGSAVAGSAVAGSAAAAPEATVPEAKVATTVRVPLALAHNEDGFSVLRLFDPKATEQPLRAVASELPPGVVRGLRWHPRLPWLAIEHSSAQTPGRLWVYELDSGALSPWSAAPRTAAGTAARSAARNEYRSLRWKSFDGLEITGLHVAPPASFSGPRPVMISLHGGPAAQSRPGFLSPGHRRLVEELGMHLILPNVRGSDGFGKTFLGLDDGLRREDAVKDVSALLDLIAGRPEMDAAKVVVEGGSYGGYLSLAVAVHESPRIAGNICRVGIANFVTFLEQTESYRRDNRRAEYGDEREPGMREFLTAISPLTRAAQIRKPLFVVHGRNDPRVPYNEAVQMVQAVRDQGTPVWFLSAEDEGHSFTQSENRTYLAEASFEFVQRLVSGAAMR